MLDISILLFLAVCAILGFWTGFVWQVIRLAGVVFAIYVGLLYGSVVARYLRAVGIELGATARNVLCPLGVTVLALLVCYLIAFLFRGAINTIKPEKADRVAGALFGLIKGALLVGVVSLVTVRGGGEGSRWRAHLVRSDLARATAYGVHVAEAILPAGLKKRIPGGGAFDWPE